MPHAVQHLVEIGNRDYIDMPIELENVLHKSLLLSSGSCEQPARALDLHTLWVEQTSSDRNTNFLKCF